MSDRLVEDGAVVDDRFDPTAPLGPGITVLEASAGTGKTHTVASLVVAEVARGRSLDELLVVTFTRKATGTLRSRIWHRLTEVSRALASPSHAAAEGERHHDPLVELLVAAEPAEREAARRRVLGALANFDSATIATTHGFCQQVLSSLGVAGDAERGLEITESVADLVDEAVDDLFVRRFHGAERTADGRELARFTRAEAASIAAAVVANPDARIAAVDHDPTARLRRRFALTLRDRIDDAKRRGRLVTYDDLLTRLADSIVDPVRGEMVAARLRRRFTMAVVDEFQDTDTLQWRILRDAFGEPPTSLVLVGDPKQAVYAFRGGDVHAYLQATRQAAARRSLTVSWRSDQPLLDALDALFDGAQLGHTSIVHRPLQARPGAERPRLLGPDGAPTGPPLVVRVLDRSTPSLRRTPRGLAQKGSASALVADDVAVQAAELLASGSTLVERDAEGTTVWERPVRPGDVAVLVRANREAVSVRDALARVGVAAVVHGGEGVMGTEAARGWLVLLRALEVPTASSRVRAAVRGPFFGWTAEDLATATDERWEEVDGAIHEWAEVLRADGIASLLRRIEQSGLVRRLLAERGGERTLADLRHVAELADGALSGRGTSVAAAATWLAEQVDGAASLSEGARRRVASDADAVSVHTIHGAKGLEFPIVLLPYLWTAPYSPDDAIPVFHDADGVRSIGVGGTGELHRWQRDLWEKEREDEELRLLYVAMTRARHRVVAWWVSANDVRTSPLGRMLMGRARASDGTSDPVVADLLRRVPDEDEVRERVAALAATCDGAIACDEVGGSAPPPGGPAAVDPDSLAVAVATRALDARWVRTSYTGLTAPAHDASPSGGGLPADLVVDLVEAAEQVRLDDGVLAAPGTSGEVVAPGPPSGHELDVELPLGEVPGGARVGTAVHELLEIVDLSAPSLHQQLAAAAARSGLERLVEDDLDALLSGVEAAIRTPWGPSFDELRLADLTPADRLDELAFDLPLAGGDTPRGSVTMTAIADVFAALPDDDPLADYHDHLRDPLLAADVRGFLTGSIDLVARHRGRHTVVDYKTNRLAPRTERLTSWHYRPEALADAMIEAHYPLQAALYLVALHRYLRWRLPGYEPDEHLGGVAYLFLRGMAGPDAPRADGLPCGVFAWHPPASFVDRLSNVLDGRAATEGER